MLRLVYRLIFLFAAEDRGLLHPPSASAAARQLYAEGYSVGALRDRAFRRAAWDRHHDRWEGLLIIFAALARGERRLGLPVLGDLFEPRTIPDLDSARLANRNLMEAIYQLAWLREDYGPVPVNWRQMETEELGSVYEGLLELKPLRTADGRGFVFAEAGEAEGNARKATASYYTPDSLVEALLDSALDPVLDRVEAEAEDPAAALLSVTVVDPACGSGHFLLAAARRIATRLARHRASGVASAEDYRRALRDVVRACIHRVDRNPLAVELTKVALWIETVDPGKPLGFLDANIRCGDSLLGVSDLDALRRGIPETAYKPLSGDDKDTARYFGKRNKDECTGQGNFDFARGGGRLPAERPLAAAARALRAMPEDSPEEVAAKRRRFETFRADPKLWAAQIAADLYTAAFLVPKTGGVPANPNTVTIPTTAHVWNALAGHTVYGSLVGRAQDLVGAARAFHWPLEFTDVMASGGFEVVLGNPPWIRQEMLTSVKRGLSAFAAFSSTADSSVYFLERSTQLARPKGRIALLTPNKWFRAAYATKLRTFLRDWCRVSSIIDFGHSRNLFPDADTFPAAVVLERVSTAVQGSEKFRFTRAHDSDREQLSLPELIREHAVALTHDYLRTDGWRLETAATNDLLATLMAAGQELETVLGLPILRGLLTGFNQAFYLQTSQRNALVSADPSSESLFKKLLRGRDVKRWIPVWQDQWHIVIPSSQNHDWPWSHAANETIAEAIFAESFPYVHNHLKKFEPSLRARADKGVFWWELRACDYYQAFLRPKIIVQCIAYYSRFALDRDSYFINNKTLLIPTDDLYILAVLNSRVSWWIINRIFQHMKDDGLSIDVQFLKRMPVPAPSSTLRAEISKLSGILTDHKAIGEDDISSLELQLNNLVERAFRLTDAQRELMITTLPPRDPISELQRNMQEVMIVAAQ